MRMFKALSLSKFLKTLKLALILRCFILTAVLFGLLHACTVLATMSLVVAALVCLQVKQLVDDLRAEVEKREGCLARLHNMVEEEYQSLAGTHRDDREHEQSPEL